MDYVFKGKITHIEEVRQGTSSNGTDWKSVKFVVEEQGDSKYPQSSVFSYFGVEKVDNFLKYNKVGDVVEVSFNLSAREYKGTYYQDNRAWKVWSDNKQSANVAPEPEAGYNMGDSLYEDDLPF